MTAPDQTTAHRAVFLSYASQDAEAAKKICDALRATGVEVWFDQNELVGGDAWDHKIRKQIKECAIFVPVISANTNARAEGYFRLEWKLAVDRSHLMADDAPFLFPVVIDDTSDSAARVPDKFREVQWTRLNVKDTPETLAKRVAKLLGGEAAAAVAGAAGDATRGGRRAAPPPKKGASWVKNFAMIGGILIGLIYAIRGVFVPPRGREAKPAAVATAPTPAVKSTAPAPRSEARQLAEKGRLLLDAVDSTADDYATAEGLVKRALELEQNDGEIWAISSRLNSMFMSRAFDRTGVRREPARSQAERALKLAPDSVEALLAVARATRNTDMPRAEAALRKALALAPNDGRLTLNLGSLYRVQNRLDEAMTFYEQAAASPEVMPLARYDQFLVSFYQRKFAEADRYVRESVAALPTTNSVTGQAMVELTWRGRPEAALRILAAAPGAVRAEPRSVIVTVLAAQMNGQPEEALAALRSFSSDYVNDAWYTGPKALLMGLCQAQANQPEAAQVTWESGIALQRKRLEATPNSANEHLRLGELLAWSGQTEAALREAKLFVQLLGGRDTDWSSSPARIYAALGRADEAVPLLAEEMVAPPSGRWPLTPALLRLDPLWSKLRGDPRFQALCVEPALSPANAPKEKAEAKPLSEAGQLAARALALITKVGFTRDDLAPAEDLARRATEKEPDNAAAWGVRAAIQSAWLFRGWDMGEKRRQETQLLANRALALDPNEPEALLALGHVLRVQRAFDQANAHLQRASTAHPDHVRLARALGYTLSQAGREAEARVVLGQAVQRHPRDPLLRYELALAYCSYGRGGADPLNLTVALEHLDAAIAIQPFSSALILKATLLGGWRGDLPAMRAVLDQQDKLPLAERAEDRAVCIGLWAGLMEHRPERVEAAAGLTARNYFDDIVMPMRPKAWSLALAHRLAGKENLARADWQTAEAVLRQRLKDDPSNLIYQAELAITLAWLDRREEGGRLIAAIEPLWKEAPTLGGKRLLAMYYAALGEAAKAAPYLAEEIDQSVFCPRIMLPLDPIWERIRAAPEFVALLKAPAPKK